VGNNPKAGTQLGSCTTTRRQMQPPLPPHLGSRGTALAVCGASLFLRLPLAALASSRGSNIWMSRHKQLEHGCTATDHARDMRDEALLCARPAPSVSIPLLFRPPFCACSLPLPTFLALPSSSKPGSISSVRSISPCSRSGEQQHDEIRSQQNASRP